MEPRTVVPFSTMSKIDSGKSPGGRPFRAMVAPREVMLTACSNALGETAVTNTPCAPPSVCALISAAGSLEVLALTVTVAPRRRARSSFASSTSTAATFMPIALAY